MKRECFFVKPTPPIFALAKASVAALGIALTLGGCANQQPSSEIRINAAHHDHAAMLASVATPSTDSVFQRDMDVGMAQMMSDMHAPGYSGNVDIDFLAMMIPHHQGAVDMARLVLIHGRDPTTRVLAEEIIAGQTIEIQSMQRRLIALRQPQPAIAEHAFPVLGGARGP